MTDPQTDIRDLKLRPRGAAGDSEWTMWSLERHQKAEGRIWRTSTEQLEGIHTPSGVEPGLFPLASTGIDMTPVQVAVEEYFRCLSLRDEAYGRFPMQHATLRQWQNGARYYLRHGLCLEDLSDNKRVRALNVIRASLSGAGYSQLMDMMHLNHAVGELRDELEILNEWLYWFSVYGSPETGEPWGWQLDGHHIVVNCVFVGDQMTLTPSFLGAEPVLATSGKYAGARVFGSEQTRAHELFTSLGSDQRDAARIAKEMPPDLFTGAYRDNFGLNYEGLSVGDMTAEQRVLADELIALYVGRAAEDHARAHMRQIREHVDRTYFAWIGDSSPGSVFYYRIHSPVILVEFEHMPGVMYDNEYATRNHVHTIVRTPNGNDYGADLLRQHHEMDHRTATEHVRREHGAAADGHTHDHGLGGHSH